MYSTTIKEKLKGTFIHPMAESESINTMPVELLLDEELIIRKIHYAKSLSNCLTTALIYCFTAISQPVHFTAQC
ncbi:MAG: hypothetical protein ACFB15_12990 [Cyclobacteriaceae bacterium]